MINRLLLCVVLIGCGKKAEPGADWSNKPLDATIESKVNKVPFKLSVPKGFKFDNHGGDDKEDNPDLITKQWRPDMKDAWSEPHFSVAYAAIPPKTIDDMIASAMLDKDDVITKKEQTADGFVLNTHTKNKGIVSTEVIKRKGDVHLVCRASQAKDEGVPSPDATIAWLEKLCSSLTLL